MAKTSPAAHTNARSKAGSNKSGDLKNFEERLEKLETLGEKIRKSDIPLDEALKAFEEGIRLARTLEQDLEKIESRIEILMNDSEAPPDSSPELELFETRD